MIKLKLTAIDEAVIEYVAISKGYADASEYLESEAKIIAEKNQAAALKKSNELLRAQRKKEIDRKENNDESVIEHTDSFTENNDV